MGALLKGRRGPGGDASMDSLCWTQLLDVTVGSPGWESISSLLLLPVVNKSESR